MSFLFSAGAFSRALMMSGNSLYPWWKNSSEYFGLAGSPSPFPLHPWVILISENQCLVFFLSTSVPVTRGIIGRRAGVGCDWESRGIGWVLFWKSSNVYFCKTLLPQWVLNLKDCIPLAFDRTQVWWLHSVNISLDAMSASNPVVLNMCCSLNAGHRDSQCEWMNGSVREWMKGDAECKAEEWLYMCGQRKV